MSSAFTLILAGGRSTRMGGGDKPLLDLDGKTVLGHVIERLVPQAERIAINANGDTTRFETFGLPVLSDLIAGFQGPLAGIHAGLAWARQNETSQILTVAGDTPFLPSDLCARLSGDASEIAVAATAGRIHPVFALWPTWLEPELAALLRKDGSRKVLSFIKQHPHRIVEFEPIELPGGPVDPFFNINTPDDLARARRLLQKPPQ